ncbi:hypothetical protein QUG57_11010 [Acinetobacter baumannii]
MAESINLEHSGSGDNIAGNKIIQSMQVGDFVKVAHELYFLINIGSFAEAKNTLLFIDKLPSKPLEVVQLLEVISIYLNAKENKKFEDISKIKEIIRLNPEKFNDLYKSILIEITFLYSSDDALAIYKIYAEEISSYIENIKYKLFSEKNELKDVFEKQLPILDDLGLFSLAKGLIRIENRDEALVVLNKINTKDENLDILKLALKFDVLSVFLDRPLMYLEKNIVDDFIQITFEFIELIKDKNELSDISLRLLTNLVITSDFSISNIMDKAVGFIEVIRPISSEVADALVIYAEKRVEVKQDLLDKINNLNPLTGEESILVLNSISLNKIDLRKVKKWISQCGEIEDENIFRKDLLLLVFKSFLFKDKKNVEEFEKDFSKFLEYKDRKIRSIQPFFIITLCENLFLFEKPQFLNTYKLLECITAKNAYHTKIYLYFLYSLMNLEKYDTLKYHFDKMEDKNIDIDFRILRARYCVNIGDYKRAKEDYYEILKGQKESLIIWREYLSVSLKCDHISETKDILASIPESILKTRAKGIFHFIYMVYSEIDRDYAEKLISKLFLIEPDFVAPYLCNLHFQLIAQSVELVANLSYEGVYEGVIYEIEGERYQKLIVVDEFAKYSHFININSNLGNALIEMNLNEERIVDYQKIKLIDKQPAFLTIFQLALKIAESNRHNSSEIKFFPFKVRDNFVVEDMKEIMQRFAVDDHTEELISNPDLPMYIKGSLFKNNEEFETVLKILQNKNANFCLSNSVGNTTASESLVLDVYSFTYLCFNHNFKALIESGISVFITQETYNVISDWIKKVTDEKFLSIRIEEEFLIKIDAETVETYYASFLKNLNQLLEYAKILAPNIIDLPDFANQIRDILSPSVFSTLKLSIANDIPWLCLDSALRTIFVKESDVKVIKLHDFLFFLANYLNFDSRKISIIQWSNFGLFTVYSYTDFMELVRSTNSEDWILLKKLLTDTPLSFNNYEQALVILSAILKMTLFKFLQRNNLAEINLLENLIFTCLNKCLDNLEGKFREDRLAKVIVEMINSISFSEYLCKIFSNILGKFAVGQFLNIAYTNEKVKMLLNQ